MGLGRAVLAEGMRRMMADWHAFGDCLCGGRECGCERALPLCRHAAGERLLPTLAGWVKSYMKLRVQGKLDIFHRLHKSLRNITEMGNR